MMGALSYFPVMEIQHNIIPRPALNFYVLPCSLPRMPSTPSTDNHQHRVLLIAMVLLPLLLNLLMLFYQLPVDAAIAAPLDAMEKEEVSVNYQLLHFIFYLQHTLCFTFIFCYIL